MELFTAWYSSQGSDADICEPESTWMGARNEDDDEAQRQKKSASLKSRIVVVMKGTKLLTKL